MVLNHELLDAVRENVSSPLLVRYIRDVINESKELELSGKEAAEEVAATVARKTQTLKLKNRVYVNATGVIIHTGWGNASLHPIACERLTQAAGATPTGPASGPPRLEDCTRFLCAITDAEAATITTSNAASYVLLGGALAAHREIIVAARDLVEISQGARISDILKCAGARVVAVGSANCVNSDDYRRAITADTAIILRIHASNMVTTGYVAHVEARALAEIAHRHDLIFAESLGGGSLVDLTDHALPWCPTLQHSVAEGADLTLASADKIIGGPQAGVIVGKKDWIDRISRHPLARICRPGKLTLSGLEATLSFYLAGKAWQEIPTLRLLNMSLIDMRRRATSLAKAFRNRGLIASPVEDTAECGGAVLPGVALPTWTTRLAHPKLQEDQLHAILLARGLVTRRKKGAVLLDLRSVLPEEDRLLRQLVIP